MDDKQKLELMVKVGKIIEVCRQLRMPAGIVMSLIGLISSDLIMPDNSEGVCCYGNCDCYGNCYHDDG